MKKYYYPLNLIIAIIVLIISLTSCSKKNQQFIFDNPTEENISFLLDNQEHILSPFSYYETKLKPGKHTIGFNSQKHDFIVYYNNSGGIINITGSNYYLWTMTYALEEMEDKVTQEENIIYIDGIEYFGPFIEVNEFIIDNNKYNWKYGLPEPFPDVEYGSSKSRGNISAKIFDKSDFIYFFEDLTDTIGFHEANSFKPKKTQPVISIPKISYKIPDFKDPDRLKLAQELSDFDKAYLEADTAKKQKNIMKKSKKVWKKYIQLTTNGEYDTEEYEKMSSFKFYNLNRGIILLN